MTLLLAPCSHQAMEYAIMNWHYSKRLPMPPHASVGAWEDGSFIGAVVFGRGATPNLSKSFGVKQTEIGELVRVALTTHAAPVTRIVSIAIRMLRQCSPGLRLLVSFADPAEGHIGRIYQAGNWLYLGRTNAEKMFLHEGRWKHRREMTSGAFKNKRERKIDWNSLPSRECPPKFRYAYPLTDETRTRLSVLAQPYPKQSSGEKGSPRGTTTGEGGSVPTSPHLFDLGRPNFTALPVESLRRLDVLAPDERAEDSAQGDLFATPGGSR